MEEHICPVCDHRERDIIDEHLAEGRSLTLASALWPDFTVSELDRHREYHIRNRTVKVQTDPIRLIRNIQTLTEHAKTAIEVFRNEGKFRPMLTAIKLALECTMCEAELSGVKAQIDPKTLLPFWNKLQQAILGTLERYPEARDAVLTAIEDVQLDEDKPSRKALM